MNDRLLRALRREPVDMTPVWIMRQAGRYLPEYRATRERAGNFMTLCKTPELACEVTLQPLARFPLDAAILFSDILTIPDAMGLGLSVEEGVGPRFARPISNARDVDALGIPDPETELRYVMDAVRAVTRELDGATPLIGFAGSPWTIASYMVEGGSTREFHKIKAMIYEQPELAHKLLGLLSDSVSAYLNAQIDAGVDVVMLFDTWGGILEARAYQEFSLQYLQRIVQSLSPRADGERIPSIVFTKGGGSSLERIAGIGATALGIDWTQSLKDARRRVGDKVALQGNMDPFLLRANPDRLEQEVRAVLADFGSGPGHIFNLGHGITPDIKPEQVALLVDLVHDLSRRN
jgi:uroporphyrinogen decarboxylase